MPDDWIDYAKGSDPVLAQAGNGANSFLDLVRRDVLASPDDDVLDPPGDEEIAFGYVGAIAGIEPAVVKQLARLYRILKIPGRCRWTAEFKAAFSAFTKLAAHVIDDADFMIRYRLPTGDKFDGVRIIERCRLSNPARVQGGPVHAVDDRRTPRRRQRDGDRIFGEAVDRRHCA